MSITLTGRQTALLHTALRAGIDLFDQIAVDLAISGSAAGSSTLKLETSRIAESFLAQKVEAEKLLALLEDHDEVILA